MRKIILLTFILLTFSFSGFAQEYEYGKPAELKDLKKVFIDTGTDLKSREGIIKEIEKAMLGIEFVDEAKIADVILAFRGETNEVETGGNSQIIGNSVITNTNRVRLAAGQGLVLIYGKNKMRLLISAENSQQSKLEKKPSTKFAKEFVKQYKIANGLK